METRLKELRLHKCIESQRELAKQISKKYGYKGEGDIISYGAIAQLEKGKANPRWDTLVILSDFFGVTPQYLMRYEDYGKETITL